MTIRIKLIRSMCLRRRIKHAPCTIISAPWIAWCTRESVISQQIQFLRNPLITLLTWVHRQNRQCRTVENRIYSSCMTVLSYYQIRNSIIIASMISDWFFALNRITNIITRRALLFRWRTGTTSTIFLIHFSCFYLHALC